MKSSESEAPSVSCKEQASETASQLTGSKRQGIAPGSFLSLLLGEEMNNGKSKFDDIEV